MDLNELSYRIKSCMWGSTITKRARVAKI